MGRRPTGFKYGHGDRVTVVANGVPIPGLWRVYSPAPERDHYYLEPDCVESRALASLLKHGMLLAATKTVRPRTVPTQQLPERHAS